MKNIKDMDINELELFFTEMGEKRFRAKQVFQWIYRGAMSFDEMTDLPAGLREKLLETAAFDSLTILKVQHSKTDGTRKYLFALTDDSTIESVLMKYQYGNSICISSQAGCRMGCDFCASGKDGLVRGLLPWEMSDQIVMAERESGEKINHVVVMGTGEPFDNYENLAKMIRLINSKEGLCIGMRNITVSTCGLIHQMKQFAEDFPQVNLAVSLHAPNDALRCQLMPVAKSYPFDHLLAACKAYTGKTGRRITFEYALIQGVNDKTEHAEELASKLFGMLCHVNLIPLNTISGTRYQASSRKTAELFRARLEKRRITATIRRELGSDIDAACGQLRLWDKGREK